MATLLDTNVVVRLILMDDDPDQTEAALDWIASNECSIPLTVFMETEWVLRKFYKLSSKFIESSFRTLIAAENLSAHEPALFQRCIAAYAQGMDFSDAVHAAQCKESDDLATFDKNFVKRAAKAGIQSVKLLKT